MSKIEELIKYFNKTIPTISEGELCNYTESNLFEFAKLYAELYAKQCLEIAAKNATLLENGEPLLVPRRIWEAYDTSRVDVEFEVDEQSITNIKLPDHE